jgi:hypothetical protein
VFALGVRLTVVVHLLLLPLLLLLLPLLLLLLQG